MGDTTIRHIISFLATLSFFIVFFAGYISGTLGWWITGILVLVLYPLIYKLVDV